MFDENIEKGPGEFVHLKDGDAVIGVVQGDVKVFWSRWVDKKTEECSKEDEGARMRFKVNIFNKELGRFQLLEQGPGLYGDFKDLQATGYDMQRTWVRLSRKGSTKNDTEYTLLTLPEHKVTDAELEMIQSHELLPLTKPEE